jgi:hypothetical protein
MFATLVWKVELETQLREAIGARALAAIARLRCDLPALAQMDLREALPRIKAPTLVMCAHLANLEQPDAVTNQILGHVTRKEDRDESR